MTRAKREGLAERLRYRQVRLCTGGQIAAKAADEGDDGPGWVEGYVAIYDVVDADGEVFRPGTFAKSGAERIAAGQVPLMVRHFRDGGDAMDVVGVVTEGRDEAKGFWVHADLFGDDAAQGLRGKILEARGKGAQDLYRLSVGFIPTRWAETEDDQGNWGVEFLEAKLLEGTVTIRPSNEEAKITAAKSIDELAEQVREGSATVENLKAFGKTLDALSQAINGAQPKDAPPAPDSAGDAQPESRRRHPSNGKRLMRELVLLAQDVV